MLLLILAVIIGIGMGLFATQNAVVVPLTIGSISMTNIPLYLVALFSLLGGLLLAGIFHLINGISSQMTISGKNRELRKSETTLQQLQAKVHELEEENIHLRTERPNETIKTQTVTEETKPTVGERVRSMFQPQEPSPTL